MTLDEGVIKFDFSSYKETESVKYDDYLAIEPTRKKMYELKLIGFYEDHKVGYGNISLKLNLNDLFNSNLSQFIISGTQTGHISDLSPKHYTYIVDYSLSTNAATSVGPILPSSESLTHAAIYDSDSAINAIIHIHNKEIWSGMISSNELFTPASIPYGTVAIANSVKELIKNNPGKSFAMAGHEDGVIIYGRNMDEACQKTTELYKKYSTNQ